MDNSPLLKEENDGYIRKNFGFYIMIMIVISSWSNSCVTMIWPLLVISDFLNFSFKIVLFLMEISCCFLLSFVSDLKNRKTSMRYSLRVMLITTLMLLIILLINLIFDTRFTRLDVSTYFKEKDTWINFNKDVIYNNILLFDENINILNTINKHNNRYFLENILNFGGEYKEILLSDSNDYIKEIFSILLFSICCILQSSSMNLYYTINLLIVENDDLDKSDNNDNSEISGWYKVCYFNIGRYASLLLTRTTFISILMLLNKSSREDEKEINFIYIYCINLLLLLILIPCGIYIVNSKFKYISNDQNTNQINDLNTYIKNIKDYIFNKQGFFWFLLVPWWIINFIQTGNNFHQWILIDENLIQVEWWEFYSLFYESILTLVISIIIPFLTYQFSPALVQIYCFVILSIVSFGLTLSTYTIHEIPVKTFIDFICAFLLCHGIFHLCCVVPYIAVLFLTIKSTDEGIKSIILAITHSIVTTAPFFDQYINNYSVKVINISTKLFSITILILFGLIFTGIFMSKYSLEDGINGSLELLPTYAFDYGNDIDDIEKKYNSF